jgi:hexosaminidase
LLPKVLGLAERSWAADPDWAIESDPIKSKSSYQTAWSVFVNQLGKFELPRLNYYAGGFNYRIPSPGYIVENGYVKVNVLYPGLSIRFTTDGSEPTSNSQSYQNHIPFSKNLKLKAFDTRQRGGKSVQVYE